MKTDPTALEKSIIEMGTEILDEIAIPSTSIFQSQYYADKFMSWGMLDEDFKINLFRFVDVLPSLSDSAAVIGHLQEYFLTLRHKIPGLLKKGLDLDPYSLAAKVIAPSIKKQVQFVAERFIVGSDEQTALKPLRQIRKNGLAFTVDLLGETAVSEKESLIYQQRYLSLLSTLSRETPKWKESAALIPGHRGEQTAINISVKLSALYSQAKPVSSEQAVHYFTERLGEILFAAKQVGGFVYVDMEDCSLTTTTLTTFKKLLLSTEFKQYDRLGIVLQAYLRRTAADVEELISWVRKRGTPIAVRLVKGAYWDTEVILARQNGWEIPVWLHKASSDANYEKLSLSLLQNTEFITPAFASHNIRSLCHAIKMAEALGVPQTSFEIQTLYGMGDPIKRAFAKRGYLVREYAPVGELIPGMAYLVRRLLENTSNEGFLRQSMHERISANTLLKKPEFAVEDVDYLLKSIPARKEFTNCPFSDFTIEENRTAMAKAIHEQKSKLSENPEIVRPIISGTAVNSSKQLLSIAPENHALVLAKVELADKAIANQAVDALVDYFSTWQDSKVEERAEILFRTAEILSESRAKITALIVLESGKTWAEADGDFAEAIDFLNYYAHEAKRIFQPKRLGNFLGENNTYFYEPRGVTLVISPWNFPLAIPCGMFAAALVTGNCAILKPAEQTSLVASILFSAFLKAGLPPRAAAFLPGIGEEIGPGLLARPETATVVFTGSKKVGLELLTGGANASVGSTHVKKIIAEMGGKNSIVVDDDADFDEAVKGIISSAFGYQGQKCSACSRAIIVGSAYHRFCERLAEAVKSIQIGPASEPSTIVGPVIDEEAHQRIHGFTQRGKQDCRLIAEGAIPDNLQTSSAFYIPPTIFANVPPGNPLLTQEIFGPVLVLEQAETFAEAVNSACNTEYGLTGGVFSRSPKNIEYAAKAFRVGNLYINRGITGALVMRQPFGGAKMSGVGSKAGGPDYLLQFVIPRVVTENTLRRGFAQ